MHFIKKFILLFRSNRRWPRRASVKFSLRWHSIYRRVELRPCVKHSFFPYSSTFFPTSLSHSPSSPFLRFHPSTHGCCAAAPSYGSKSFKCAVFPSISLMVGKEELHTSMFFDESQRKKNREEQKKPSKSMKCLWFLECFAVSLEVLGTKHITSTVDVVLCRI